MKNFIFSLVHFLGGFCVLWLSYALVNVSFQVEIATTLWAKTLVETAFLICGVIWGNMGWDARKLVSKDSAWSYVVFEISRSSAPLAIVLPIFLAVFDFCYKARLATVDYALHWQQIVLLGVSLLVILVLVFYRRSERAFWYRHTTP